MDLKPARMTPITGMDNRSDDAELWVLDFRPKHHPMLGTGIRKHFTRGCHAIIEMPRCIRIWRVCHHRIDLAERRQHFQTIAQNEAAVANGDFLADHEPRPGE